MKTSAWILGAYAALVLVGGIMGYVQAKSLPSLIMGGSSAALLFGAAFFTCRGVVSAAIFGQFVTLFLAAFFALANT